VITTQQQPCVTVDLVLLTLKNDELLASLVKRDHEPLAGVWTLPGGRVHPDEDQDALGAAVRILKAKAGLTSPYLEQLHTFSGAHRDPRGWSVSIVHYALVPYASVQERGNDRLWWVPVEECRSLPFDHLSILRLAVARVRSKTLYSSLPVHLMPKTFSLSELQRVYEVLLRAPLDKRTFRRRIEELDVVERVPGLLQKDGAHRPAQQYRLKPFRAHALATADSNLALRA